MVWDKKICHPSTNFRKEILDGTYKANRDKSNNEDIYQHETILEKLCEVLGIGNIFPYKLEADDVISWLTTVTYPNIIVTTDKDMLQLINNYTQYYHLGKKIVINEKNFEEQIGVPLKAYIYYKAILGDASDNVPGIPGYGKVRSKKLCNIIAENNGDLKKSNLAFEYREIIEKNLKICDLNKSWENEVPEEIQSYITQFEILKNIQPDFVKFHTLCQRLEFESILKNFEDWEALFTLQASNKNALNMLS